MSFSWMPATRPSSWRAWWVRERPPSSSTPEIRKWSSPGLRCFGPLPRKIGLDAQRVLYGIDAPVYLVSFENVRLERWAKLMSDEIENMYDLVIYGPAPDGVAWTDVYGEEFVGRLLDFVEYAAGV